MTHFDEDMTLVSVLYTQVRSTLKIVFFRVERDGFTRANLVLAILELLEIETPV